MLPMDKDEFPKCVYLDQNFWSDFAKTENGMMEGAKKREWENALGAFYNSLKTGKVIYPISLNHAVETPKTSNRSLRQKIAEFMVDNSKNKTMLNSINLTQIEILNAVFTRINRILLGEKLNSLKLRPALIGEGMEWTWGVTKNAKPIDLKELMIAEADRSFATSSTMSKAYLTDNLIHKRALQIHKETDKATKAVEDARTKAANLPSRERRFEDEIYEFFMKGDTSKDINIAIKLANVSLTDFYSLFKTGDDYKEFVEDVPTYYARIQIQLQYGMNLEKKTTASDLNDIDAITNSIVYCNGIAVDKEWGGIAKDAKLDKKYSTKIITKIEEFPNMLEELGVL